MTQHGLDLIDVLIVIVPGRRHLKDARGKETKTRRCKRKHLGLGKYERGLAAPWLHHCSSVIEFERNMVGE